MLYSFAGGLEGAFPGAGLVRDAMGTFYGDTLGGGLRYDGAVFELAPSGAETVPTSRESRTDRHPGPLRPGPWHPLWRGLRWGWWFGMRASGLRSDFCGHPNRHGKRPLSLHRRGRRRSPRRSVGSGCAGQLLWHNRWGGTLNSFCPQGCGTVFELSPGAGDTWSLTVLHGFTDRGTVIILWQGY